MNNRLKAQKKSSSNSAPMQNQLQSRPFAVQAKTETASPQPQENSAGITHNLANISIFAPEAPIQTKLTIGKPGDKYEQEADRVAAQVVSKINAPESQNVQRQEMAKNGEQLQKKPEITTLQRQGMLEEDDEELQMKTEEHEAIEGGNATPNLEASINQARSGGQPLPNQLRRKLEGAFEANFSGVKVHTDNQSDKLNRSLHSRAFTTGQNLFFKHGEYNPNTRSGQELLAHELTHVVQQTSSNKLQRKSSSTQQVTPANLEVSTQYNNNRVIQQKGSGSAVTTQQTPFNAPVIQRANLSTLQDVTKERMKELLKKDSDEQKLKEEEQKFQDAIDNVRNERFMQDIFDKVADKKQKRNETLPTDEDLAIVIDIINNEFAKVEDLSDGENLCFDELNKRPSKVPTQTSLLHEFFTETKKFSRGKVPQVNRTTRSEYRRLKRGENVTESNVTNAFIKSRKGVKIEQERKLTEQEKKDFAAALKEMPTVDYLLKKHESKVMPVSQFNADWKNGGFLSNSIEVKMEKSNVRNKIDDCTFKHNVDRADQFIRAIVEPQLLAQISRPKIVVHTDYALTYRHPLGFRAYQNDNEVHVAQDEDVSVIVHEIGHYLEDNLPSEVWHDIQLLIRSRHNLKGGGNKAAYFRGTPLEKGFKGKYPATGKYTSRDYGDRGSTEMMSMSLEFLARPKDAVKLIEKDPQQAAIILRGIRPKEYAATAALRNFDQFLPN